MRSLPWICGAPQRKFSPAICAIRWRTSLDILGRPPRQRPREMRTFDVALGQTRK